MQAHFTTPLLRILLPLAAGIAVGEWFFFSLTAYSWLLFLLWTGMLLCWGLALWRHRSALWLLQGGTLLLGMALLVSVRQSQTFSWPQQAQSYRAVVIDTPKPLSKSWRVRARLLDAPVRDRLVELLLVEQDVSPRIGDALFLHTTISSPSSLRNPGESNRAAYLRQQGISGTALVFRHDWCISPIGASLTLRERALLLRETLVEKYRSHFHGRTLGVLAAMTLGERSLLDPETRALYAQTGSSHVLALSGLHLSILFLLFQGLTTRLRRYNNRLLQLAVVLLGLLFIWTFVFVAGFPLSLLRAALMLSLAQIFQLFARRSGALHSLTLSAILLLLWSPQWLFDVGFQLSCAAVAGIVLFRPLIPTPSAFFPISPREALVLGGHATPPALIALKRLALALWELLLVSFFAQLATAPLVAFYFHQLSWTGLLSSLLIVPAAYLILAGALLFFLLPFGKSLLAQALTLLLDGIALFLQQLTHLPFSSWSLWPSARSVCLAYGLLLLVLWCQAHWRRFSPLQRYGSIGFSCLALGASLLLDAQPTPLSQPQILLYRHQKLTAIHCLSPSGKSVLLASDTLLAKQALGATARNWWQPQKWQVEKLPLTLLHNSSGCAQLNTHPALLAIPHVLCFAGQRWAVVDDALAYTYPREPLLVDALLLLRGARGRLPHLLRHYKPRLLVLCASLSPYQRTHYLQAAQKLHLPVHDVEQRGVYSAPNKK